MKVNELIKELKNNENLNLKDMLEIRTYIPIEEKKLMVEEIMDKSINTEEGFLDIDSIKKKICFEIAMIKYHTNLDINEDDYDILFEIINDELDLHDFLKSYYEKDYAECETILYMALNDLGNRYSITTSVAQLCNLLSDKINQFAESITNNVENFNLGSILPKDINVDELKVLLEKYAK